MTPSTPKRCVIGASASTESQGDVLHVVFTRRSAAVRIISVRRANRKEIEIWRLRE